MPLCCIVIADMSIYSEKFTLANKDVDLYRRLRTSRLFEMLQAVSVAHTEQLGAGRQQTLDHGILWVVIQQSIQIHRMPAYEETITVETWPGRTMHVLFPRYYEVKDAHGSVLIQGSSLWTLIDQKTRKMVFADDYGIDIAGNEQKEHLPLPKALHQEETEHHVSFTVPYSYCDLNGHMNNARYFDLAEDNTPCAAAGACLQAIAVQYSQEIRYGSTIDLNWAQKGSVLFLSGDEKQNHFRMKLTYQKKI